MNCCKCHEKLSRREENEYREALEYSPYARPICDECFEMENYSPPDYEQPSDADMGL